MVKIEDLKNIDLTKVPEPYQGLVDGIKSLINDYDNETDQAYFEKEAQENIKSYIEIVKSVAPEAIEKLPPKEPKPKEEKQKVEKKSVKQQKHTNDPINGEKKMPLRDIASDVANTLADMVANLEKEDATIIGPKAIFFDYAAGLSLDVDCIQTIENTIVSYDEEKDDITDKKVKDSVDAQIQKLRDALETMNKQASEKETQSKEVRKKVASYEKDIDACRSVIREFNKQKRANEPNKPKPSRRTLLKKKVLNLVKLTPEPLVGDPKVQAENREIVKATLKGFMNNWDMTRIKEVESAVDKEFDTAEEKVEAQASKAITQKWRKEIPHAERIIAFEKSHNKLLLEEAAKQIIAHIYEAIQQYALDKDKAFKYLVKHLNVDQRKAYLPKYIHQEMTQSIKPNKS